MKHVVGFSGGIDSQACALWVRQRYAADDVILMFSDTGNEHPITLAHVERYSSEVHPVVTVVPLVRDVTGSVAAVCDKFGWHPDDRLTFDRLARWKMRFPGRKSQFCTEFLKLRPQRRWLKENLDAAGIDYERYSGVRRDESEKRKDVLDTEWDAWFDCQLHRPIAAWSKADCFAAVQAAGEPVNPLYTHGFSRVGCAPCINSAKEDIRLWAARFPEMIDKLRVWERAVGRTFFPPILPGRPKGSLNWIDEVVQWSRTERGGRQLSLPFLEADAAAGACSSKYGLCE